MVKEGIEFINADPGVVKGYIISTERSRLDINPANLKLIEKDNLLVLQVMNGTIREFPVRKTFLYKLLKWYRFPVNQLCRLSLDTITSICNDFLMNIKSDYVTLKIEKGDALTILSPGYNEITDLDVIKSCEEQGNLKISRNDFFLSITTDEKFKTEPVPGDECGIGLNIVNSETGFRALTVSHYILRYICSNGAVIQLYNKEDNYKKYHYGMEDLGSFLCDKIAEAFDQREIIADRLKKLNVCKNDKSIDHLIKKMESVLSKVEVKDFLADITEEMTKYQLFNLVTSAAKQYDLSKRYFLESFAGDMLFN